MKADAITPPLAHTNTLCTLLYLRRVAQDLKMVETILLPPSPHLSEDHGHATCSEPSHVVHQHNGQRRNHGVLNGVTSGDKIKHFGFEMLIEQDLSMIAT